MALQSVLNAVFPHRCASCGVSLGAEAGLCPECWRETAFVTGLACDLCGTPLPGQPGDDVVHCDDCLTIARPWDRGRTVFLYEGVGRRLVLALKRGDRTDLAAPAGRWLAGAARPLLAEPVEAVVVPVPSHWRRLLRRRFNQAALLSRATARELGASHAPLALRRIRATPLQDGRSRDERFENLGAAICPAPGGERPLQGRAVLLVDDVMTSGATLAAATEAAHAGGAASVCVVALARVAKAP